MCRLLLLLLLVLPTHLLAAVISIEITGLSDPLLQNVQSSISLVKQKDNPRLSNAAIRRSHAKAPEEIRKALQPFGYYQPQITAELVELEGVEDDSWRATYQVDAGEPIRFKTVDIRILGEGQGNGGLKKHLDDLAPSIDDVFVHQQYETLKRELLAFAQDQGFLDARYIRREPLVDIKQYNVRLTLYLDTGTRYRFGDVEFIQDTFTNDFLQTFLTFQPGDFYNADDYVAFRNALTNSNFFEQINMERLPPSSREEKDIPIRVTLIPQKRNRYRIRLGYGTDTELRMKLDWQRRYVNRYGHSFNAGLIGVQNKKNIVTTLDYIIPRKSLQNNYWRLGLRYEGEDLNFEDVDLSEGDETRVQSLNLLGAYHRPRRLGKYQLEEVLSLEYLLETYNLFEVLFGDLPDFIEGDALGQREILEQFPEFAALDTDFKTLIPGIAWRYVDADDLIYSRHGQQIGVSIKAAFDGVASNADFSQFRLNSKWIRSFFDNRSGRMIFRTDAAYTSVETFAVGGSNIHEMPESLQFLTGGDRSVRGYSYESLKSDDNLLFGKHLLVGSLEYEQRIWKEWGAAAFYDIGNAFNSYSDMQLKAGAGIGLRWYSPIGPVRIDFAKPLADGEDGIQFHINIGPDF